MEENTCIQIFKRSHQNLESGGNWTHKTEEIIAGYSSFEIVSWVLSCRAEALKKRLHKNFTKFCRAVFFTENFLTTAAGIALKSRKIHESIPYICCLKNCIFFGLTPRHEPTCVAN